MMKHKAETQQTFSLPFLKAHKKVKKNMLESYEAMHKIKQLIVLQWLLASSQIGSIFLKFLIVVWSFSLKWQHNFSQEKQDNVNIPILTSGGSYR